MQQGSVLVAEFDSVRQRHIWERLGQESGRSRFIGVMRLAVLLEENLVVTYAQVLDGICFLSFNPSELALELGLGDARDLPITVALESDMASLQHGHNSMRSRDDFVWSSQAAAYASDPGADLALNRGAWIDLDDRGGLQHTTFAFDLAYFTDALDDNTPGSLIPERMHAALNIRHGAVSQLAKWRRSEVVRYLDSELFENRIGPRERDRVYAWWNAAYIESMARGLGARFISTDESGDYDESARRGGVVLTKRPGTLRHVIREQQNSDHALVNGLLVDRLVAMPPAMFAVARYRTEAEVLNWRMRRNQSSLNGVAMAVREMCAPLGSWRGRLLWRCLRAGVFGLLAIVLLLADITALGSSRASVLLVAVAGLLVTLPWADLKGLLEARPGALRAEVRLTDRS